MARAAAASRQEPDALASRGPERCLRVSHEALACPALGEPHEGGGGRFARKPSTPAPKKKRPSFLEEVGPFAFCWSCLLAREQVAPYCMGMNTTTTAAAKNYNNLSGAAREALLAVRAAAKPFAVEGTEAYEVVYGDPLEALLGDEVTAYAYLAALLGATGDARPVLLAAFAFAEAANA